MNRADGTKEKYASGLCMMSISLLLNKAFSVFDQVFRVILKLFSSDFS